MLLFTFFHQQSSFFKISIFILLLPFFLVIPANIMLAQVMPPPPSDEAIMPPPPAGIDDTPQTTTGASQSINRDWEIETGIPIAGLKKDTPIADPGVYFNKIYTFAVSASMVVAIIMIVYAGLMWMTSPYLVQKKEAIDRMTGVALGILLLLASNLILKTINPNLVNWNLSGLTSVEGLSDSIFGIGVEGTAGGGGSGTVTGSANNERIVSAAKNYIGKPSILRDNPGNSCAAFTSSAVRDAGATDQYDNYAPNRWKSSYGQATTDTSQLQPGDEIFYTNDRSGSGVAAYDGDGGNYKKGEHVPVHVGIYVGEYTGPDGLGNTVTYKDAVIQNSSQNGKIVVYSLSWYKDNVQSVMGIKRY